ncbi:MAG: 3-oxoacyl-(acyl-carrier-protein) reductase FabG [Bacteroidetes bacterium ADurb.Bin035]|nr:MAG: 3-oxoacyl-(acyl-carrier-protein) reductase FabG [Bacteroidetes bacterium ADurb.Bin035]
MFSQKKDVILIVGGGSGIGKAIAEQLIALKEDIIIADININNWDTNQINNVVIYQLNVTDEESIIIMIENFRTEDIYLKGLVYTVGKAVTLPLNSIKTKIYKELIELDTISFFNLVETLATQQLISEQGASIVVISLVVGQYDSRGKTAYGLTKGAIDSGIKSLVLEMASSKIRINAIAPGTVQMEMLDKLISSIGDEAVKKMLLDYPLGLGYPQDISDLAVFLLSNQSKWITGSVITIDGGYSAR